MIQIWKSWRVNGKARGAAHLVYFPRGRTPAIKEGTGPSEEAGLGSSGGGRGVLRLGRLHLVRAAFGGPTGPGGPSERRGVFRGRRRPSPGTVRPSGRSGGPGRVRAARGAAVRPGGAGVAAC
jgi:hypothetical protein